VKFAVGEVALLVTMGLDDPIVWPLHGRECEVVRQEGQCPVCRHITYEIDLGDRLRFRHVPEWALRKLPPPNSPERWENCVWRPQETDASIGARLREKVRRALEEIGP
jgi:hypothetical protein